MTLLRHATTRDGAADASRARPPSAAPANAPAPSGAAAPPAAHTAPQPPTDFAGTLDQRLHHLTDEIHALVSRPYGRPEMERTAHDAGTMAALKALVQGPLTKLPKLLRTLTDPNASVGARVGAAAQILLRALAWPVTTSLVLPNAILFAVPAKRRAYREAIASGAQVTLDQNAIAPKLIQVANLFNEMLFDDPTKRAKFSGPMLDSNELNRDGRANLASAQERLTAFVDALANHDRLKAALGHEELRPLRKLEEKLKAAESQVR